MADNATAELARAWQERCQRRTFSPAILGLGTIRVMGRSGDASILFPRITSLDALEELEPDERYAVEAAQAIIEQARQQNRAVFAVAPGRTPERLNVFRAGVESLMIVARVTGG